MITDPYVKEIFIDSEIPKENYIYDLPVVKFLKNNRLKLTKPVTFIVGETEQESQR